MGDVERAAGRDAVLVEVGDRAGGAGPVEEEIVGGKGIGLVEFPAGAVEGVGAALGDLVQGSAGGVAEGGVDVGDFDAHFLHRVLGRAECQPAVPGGVGGAVEKQFAGLLISAADHPAGRPAAIERVDEGWLGIADDTQGKRGGHHWRAAVDGQLFDFLGGDGLADGGVFGIELRSVGGDFHRSGDVADIETHVDYRVIARADVDSLPGEGFEARRLHRDIVIAGEQERSGILAGRVRNGRDLGASVDFGNDDFGSGNRRSRGIGHCAADGAAKFLGE